MRRLEMRGERLVDDRRAALALEPAGFIEQPRELRIHAYR